MVYLKLAYSYWLSAFFSSPSFSEPAPLRALQQSCPPIGRFEIQFSTMISKYSVRLQQHLPYEDCSDEMESEKK